ncbi:hypothetical protein [Ensifer aridi]|uniref:hypothetical protein n=1 Tax=Ensifer aridi TaxID=1708715 RepID=UPI0015E445A7|nr:hypothetical protein [Ensifer aridi]
MKSDMAAYRVTELTPAEASGTSGGMFWAIAFAILGVVGLAAVTIAAKAADQAMTD